MVGGGEPWPAGLREKTRFVLQLMRQRLLGLGLNWSAVSQVDIYTPHRLDEILSEAILPNIGEAAIHGVHWHFSRPPIAEIEFDMDLRAVVSEFRA